MYAAKNNDLPLNLLSTSNMKYLILIFCSFLLRTGNGFCGNKLNDISLAISKPEPQDSTRNSSSYYYLSDLDIKIVGKLILRDSLTSSDNYITFKILDTISKSEKATRDYLFPVFKKIIAKSDGALSEVVGMYAIQYITAYPKEFSERYSCCNKLKSCCEDLILVSEYVGSEIMLGENPTDEYASFITEIKRNFPGYGNDKTMQFFIGNLENYMQKLKSFHIDSKF
jgi:hypothetical protein